MTNNQITNSKRERIMWWAGGAISLLLVVGGLLWGYLALHNSGAPIVLHYSENLGITQIGNTLELWLFGVAGLVFVGLNLFIVRALLERDTFLAYSIVAITLTISALLFIGFATIISVN